MNSKLSTKFTCSSWKPNRFICKSRHPMRSSSIRQSATVNQWILSCRKCIIISRLILGFTMQERCKNENVSHKSKKLKSKNVGLRASSSYLDNCMSRSKRSNTYRLKSRIFIMWPRKMKVVQVKRKLFKRHQNVLTLWSNWSIRLLVDQWVVSHRRGYSNPRTSILATIWWAEQV